MKKRLSLGLAAFVPLLLLCVVSTCLISGPVADDEKRLLVSTSWLAEHLHDPSVVVFHVASSRRDYLNGHIPGSMFLWTQSLSQNTPDLSLELPSMAQADSVLRNLGINDGVHIVLYFSSGNVTPTTRIFMTLEYLGLGGHVYLLDGGLDAWRADGHPIAKEITTAKHGSYKIHERSDAVVDCDFVKASLTNPHISIVDARGSQFYNGTSAGMTRSGHIPGAVNIPFTTLVDSTNKLKDKKALEAIFREAGVKPGNTIVAYCHVGQQATLVYFAARYLGYDVRLYDGSFDDWSGREELPIVNPAAENAKK